MVPKLVGHDSLGEPEVAISVKGSGPGMVADGLTVMAAMPRPSNI